MLDRGVVVRTVAEKDIQTLVALMRIADYRPDEWSSQIIKKYLRKKGQEILVLEQKGALLGYVCLNYVENEDPEIRKIIGHSIDDIGCVEWIAVHSNYRGRGFASQLLLAAKQWMRKNKRRGIWLDCRKNVVSAYEKNSYTIAGTYDKQSKKSMKIKKYVLVNYF